MRNGKPKTSEKKKNGPHKRDPIIKGSGNPYADLGFPNPKELLAKAEVVRRIVNLVRERELTQQQAAELLELSQPTFADLMRGRFADFSMDHLLQFLHALRQNVEIIIRPMPASQEQAYTQVTAG